MLPSLFGDVSRLIVVFGGAQSWSGGADVVKGVFFFSFLFSFVNGLYEDGL